MRNTSPAKTPAVKLPPVKLPPVKLPAAEPPAKPQAAKPAAAAKTPSTKMPAIQAAAVKSAARKAAPAVKAAPVTIPAVKTSPVKASPVKAAPTVRLPKAKTAPLVRAVAESPAAYFAGTGGRAWRMSGKHAVAYVRDASLAGELLATETKHLARSAMAVYYDRKGKAFAWQLRFDTARWAEVVGRLGQAAAGQP